MNWQNETSHDDVQTYLFTQDEECKPKMQLAIPITIPRTGPLILGATASPRSPPRKKVLGCQQAAVHYSPRQQYLNRLPVPDVQRPIEAIEKNLGYLSLAELKQQVLADQGSPRLKPNPVLPTLNPLLKYSPIGSNHLTLDTSNCSTQQAHGHMDIHIRYSRHATPTAFLPSQGCAYLPTQGTSGTYTPLPQARMYPPLTASFSVTVPPLREMTSFTKQTDTHKHAQDDRVLVNETDYLRPTTGHLNRPFSRPTIAPHSIHASAIRRFKPITANTVLKGRGLMCVSPLLSSKR